MNRSLEGLLIGRTLADRYLVEEVVGRGGMSVVYRARDERLGRAVAIKVIALDAHTDEERNQLRERFRREAAAAASIPPHPNVVQVYDYGTDDALNLDFIAMELLRGRDLKDELTRSALDRVTALRVVREAARGLAAGHRAGVIHRDVKPGNIFLGGDTQEIETIRVLDFGIAKAIELHPEDLTVAGQLPHSPAYASPEQLDPASQITPASDVFQLGLVAYELLAGERPFDAEERKRLLTEEVAPPTRGAWRQIPEPVRQVIARCLRRDPAERYPQAAAFAEALAAAEEQPADDATLLAPLAAGGHDAPPPDAPISASPRGADPVADAGGPSPVGRSSRAPLVRRAAIIGGSLILAAAAVWALTATGGDAPGLPDTTTEISTDAGALDLAALDEEFQELQLEAYRNLRESAAPMEGSEAAATVMRVIADANQSWVREELDRHISYYADRVDFYNDGNARRSEIRETRQEALETYSDRQITIERQAVEFPEPGRARALVDKSWEFSGRDGSWEGSVRQELILELIDGQWLITAENDLEVYESNRQEN